MKSGSRQKSCCVIGLFTMCAVFCALEIVHAQGQSQLTPKPLMAEEAFKNVQVLKGISESEFMASMGFFSASLGESCEYCHNLEHGTWEDYAIDTPLKQKTRQMVLMTDAINKNSFRGQRAVTCYSCHNGGDQPKVIPSITKIYAPPMPEDPDDAPLGTAPKSVSADQILNKYVSALGGAQRLAGITSFIAKGISVGYGDEAYNRNIEIFAKAPDQRTTIIHTLTGDNTTTFDGNSGWIAAPSTAAPVPVVSLAGSDLLAAKIDAQLLFPAQIQQEFTNWRVGRRATIDGKAVEVLQGMSAIGFPVRLYFDTQSGLLVRQLRYTDSGVGLNATRIDYGDYRDVSGIKMPFHWVVTWFDGRSTFDMKDVQTNVPIDATKFAKPEPPTAPARPKS